MSHLDDWFYPSLEFIKKKWDSFTTPVFVAGGTVKAQLVGDTGSSQTDDITGALVTIPVVHHEVHEGEMFVVSYKSPHATPIVDDGVLDIVIETGPKYCHLTYAAATGGDAELEIYEGSTVNVAGTGLTEFNLKRYSPEAATAAATHSPTMGALGTRLLNPYLPGGQKNFASGAAARANTEWILKLNTIYLFRVTNRAGSAQEMGQVIQWYEESDA